MSGSGRRVLRWGWLVAVVAAAVVWACSAGKGSSSDESVGQSGSADTSQPGATCAQGYLSPSVITSGGVTTFVGGSYAGTVASFTIPATIAVSSGKSIGLTLTLDFNEANATGGYGHVACTYAAASDQAELALGTCTVLVAGAGTLHPVAGTSFTNPYGFTLAFTGSGTAAIKMPVGSVVLDDGNPCTIDTCAAGGGRSVANSPAGTLCGCGMCNGGGYCFAVPAPDAGNSCAATVACVGGQWVSEPPAIGCSVPDGSTSGFNATVATSLVNTAAFLFTGPDGGTGSINPTDVAVVRGRVFANTAHGTDAGAPTLLANAIVSILGHPEFGTVLTRSDGWYDIAVNGGGPVTVVIAPPTGMAYFSVQREVSTAWHQYAVVPDVYLTLKDTTSNPANPLPLGSASYASIRGATLKDPNNGPTAVPHTARVLMPPSTTATFQYGTCASNTDCTQSGTTCVGGVCQGSAPSSLTVHATEYTYGANGPASLPGNLPSSTAYTYAVELSADEADAAGASVVFSSPVFFYLENIINFPVGTVVPVGFYDRTHGHWVATPNGEVIEISSFGTCSGGSGTCAALATPDGGNTNPSVPVGELQWLATTYSGATLPVQLWRVPIPHFSGWDTNWPYEAPAGASGPPPGGPPGPAPGGPIQDPGCVGGSIIECQNSILAQQFPLVGTPYALRYQSERAPGHTPGLQIPLTGSTIPRAPLNGVNQLQGIDVNVSIAGVSYNMSYPASELLTNETVTWPWNRKDAYGNTVQGLSQALVTVNNVYAAEYMGYGIVGTDAFSFFGLYSTSGLPFTYTENPAATQLSIGTTTPVLIGVEDPEPQGLGGFTVSVNHLYDPETQTFWGGDGSRRVIQPASLQVDTIPQTTPIQSQLVVAAGADGTVYFSKSSGYIHTLSPQGILSTLAGNNTSGTYEALSPISATSMNLSSASAVAIAPNGLLYEAGYGLINVIDPVHGTIQTIAGSPDTYACTDSPVGLSARLGSVVASLAVALDGTVYFVDQTCGRLRRLGTDGSVTSVTAPSTSEAYTNGVPVATVGLTGLGGVAVANDGTIYVTDTYNGGRLSRIDGNSGAISRVAGGIGVTANQPLTYDGRAAISLPLTAGEPSVATAPDGSVYINSHDTSSPDLYNDVGQLQSYLLWRIDPEGIAHLVAGNGHDSGLVVGEGDGASALNCSLYDFGDTQGIAVAPDGSIVFTDGGYQAGDPARLRRIHSPFPGYQPGAAITVVPSQDGTQFYGFDKTGRHQYTYDGKTGATLLSFGYDAQSRLLTILDSRSGGTTHFTYGSGTVTITAPLGQQTKLTLDGVAEPAYPTGPGRATAIQNPNEEITQFTYTNGLMTSLKDPKGQLHTFTYDSIGQLIQDADPTGASKLLNRVASQTPLSPDGGAIPGQSWSTAITSGAGDVTTHQVQTLSSGGTKYTDVSPSGATQSYTHTSGDVRTVIAKDGTTTVTTTGPDPQFGMIDPIMTSVTRSTPAGLVSLTTRSRAVTASSNVLSPASITETVTRGAPTGSGQLTTTRVYTSSGVDLGGTEVRTMSLAGTSLTRSVLRTLDAFGRTTQTQPVVCPGGTCTPAVVPGTSTPMAATTSVYGGALNQLSSLTVGTREWSFVYDASGNLYSATDPADETTTYDLYDSNGRLKDTELPLYQGVQSHVARTYDLNGNLATITVPPATGVPSTHTFNYTPVDLVQSYDPPQVSSADGGVETPLTTLNTSYTYDGDHNLLTSVVPEGTGYDTVIKLYDPYGRPSSTYDPISGVTSTYTFLADDKLGSVATSDGITTTNTYDGFLKKSTSWSSTLFNGSVSWTYDNLFRPETLAVGGGTTVTMAYVDPDGLYTGTTSPAFALTRDQATGLATSATLGSVNEAWTYDTYGDLASDTVTSGSTMLYSLSIASRDADGRVTGLTEEINSGSSETNTWAYSYDSRGRLWTAVESGTYSENNTYTYDPNDNMTDVKIGSVNHLATIDAQDRLLDQSVSGGSWGFGYTNNGDVATKANGPPRYAFTYDLSRNLRKATYSVYSTLDDTLTYEIDGLNRRIGKTIVPSSGTTVSQGFVYDEQGRVVAEIDGSTVKTFVYGLKSNVPDYMIVGSTTYRIVSDWRGSVRLVVNTGTGAVAQQIDYDDWGQVVNLVDASCTVGGIATCFQPFGFAGGLYDTLTGFVRFGARDYDPQARRWMQKDPIRFDGGQANIYVYVGNDPINRLDPGGLEGPDNCSLVTTALSAVACTRACIGASGGVGAYACAVACALGTGTISYYVCNWPPPPPPPPPPTCASPPNPDDDGYNPYVPSNTTPWTPPCDPGTQSCYPTF